jgi:D-xylose 1-dehydrogenase (NADP+, D-xylono-1,5-lactone-forming)
MHMNAGGGFLCGDQVSGVSSPPTMPTSSKLRWGILGTGNIACQFAAAMRSSKQGIVTAVGSRTARRAGDFAARYKIEAAHGSYESLLADANIDAIYNSLPNSLHAPWTIAALKAGKHVLCEKPLALNAREAKKMFDQARKSKRLLVEAFMYRSHPVTQAVLDAVRAGAIGKLKLIRTSFCFRTRKIRGNVRFVRELGGGGLMDIGCYCINFARLIAGSEPTAIQAAGTIDRRGVDDLISATLIFKGGLISQFVCGLAAQADNTANLCGDEGYIQIPLPWKPKPRATFIITKGIAPRMDNPRAKSGPPPRKVHAIDAGSALYALEADDFALAVQGKTPPRISAADSIGNMKILDEIRRQIGLDFD